jgi:hypothetical protein
MVNNLIPTLIGLPMAELYGAMIFMTGDVFLSDCSFL